MSSGVISCAEPVIARSAKRDEAFSPMVKFETARLLRFARNDNEFRLSLKGICQQQHGQGEPNAAVETAHGRSDPYPRRYGLVVLGSRGLGGARRLRGRRRGYQLARGL